ncbi:hypothetical protein OsI_14042 [Oryza sativa Indica Group]|uniref:J domain-containing protein n=1 Tax=Oryza sativa subsp. indica TaxID=39946 RepID=B8AM91_ORYSI|nr:hypothetical protein OsI_14042 [Oryza sativa Indica Group]
MTVRFSLLLHLRRMISTAVTLSTPVEGSPLKFHPDLNKKVPNAQEKFLRIKHAYNTLMNSESRFNWCARCVHARASIGEEFVEFLENELKIDDSSTAEVDANDPYTESGGKNKQDGNTNTNTSTSSFDDSVSEIAVALENLKELMVLGHEVAARRRDAVLVHPLLVFPHLPVHAPATLVRSARLGRREAERVSRHGGGGGDPS